MAVYPALFELLVTHCDEFHFGWLETKCEIFDKLLSELKNETTIA